MRHHIQKSILDKLASAPSRRYSEIKPVELDGNTFGYHLKALIAEKYVLKTNDGDYELTAKGRDFIVRRYEDPAHSAHSIYLIVIRNGSNYLLRERMIQPLLGYVGFVHGEPQPGIGVVESAQRRLTDKTGLIVELKVKGSTLITQYQNNELQSFSHATILYGETDQLDIIESDETGKNSWSELSGQQLLPSCHDIVAMIDGGETWLDKTYNL